MVLGSHFMSGCNAAILRELVLASKVVAKKPGRITSDRIARVLADVKQAMAEHRK